MHVKLPCSQLRAIWSDLQEISKHHKIILLDIWQTFIYFNHFRFSLVDHFVVSFSFLEHKTNNVGIKHDFCS